MSKAKKPFLQRSRTQRLWLLMLTAGSVLLVIAAERDIQRRPADRVRGNRLLWRLVSLNALGSLSYFRWGRRA
ncbi:MAG TPA: hypothetical protein VN845_12095 [Solirubrobacteraceae bacterium]|nr:hypothetical protein [Solirubrobacteraceae bacterium]